MGDWNYDEHIMVKCCNCGDYKNPSGLTWVKGKGGVCLNCMFDYDDMMIVRKYVKKPVEIEATQLTAGNLKEVVQWINDNSEDRYASCDTGSNAILIHTLEGIMKADVSDWIIKGVAGELYPCRNDIFQVTYGESEE